MSLSSASTGKPSRQASESPSSNCTSGTNTTNSYDAALEQTALTPITPYESDTVLRKHPQQPPSIESSSSEEKLPAGSTGYPRVEPCECTVTEFEFSDRNTDSELAIMCHGNRVHITISAENLQASLAVQSRYLHFLKVAESYELDGLTVDDLYDRILERCAPEIHLPPAPRHENPSLQYFIHPPTFHYALSAADEGAFTLVRRDDMPAEHLRLGVTIDEELCSSWNSFHPSQVQICAESPGEEVSGTPRKVQTTGGQVHFFKPYRYCDTRVAKNELKKYSQISAASGLEDLCISRLSGLVRDESGTVLGLLLSYIDAKALTLRFAVRPDTPLSSRNRWVDQITNALNSLHAAGIIWGDAKPDNVLIDSKSDAWLIDFGGSFTEGSVDPELAEIVKGDMQGLSRILEYVFDNCGQDSNTRSLASEVKVVPTSLLLTKAASRLKVLDLDECRP